MSNKPITVTMDAAQHIKKMLEKRGEGIGLRLGTRVSGCTGYAYVVDYADTVGSKDNVFESNGIKVIVDEKSLPILSGTEVDYVKQNILNHGFEFRNPNIQDECGCGESFNVS